MIAVLIAGALVSAASAQPPAGEKPPAKNRSLDQQLLDDLDKQLLEGLPGSVKPSPKDNKSPPTAAKPLPQTEPLDAPQNPLAKIAQRMRTAEGRIAGRDTSTATQQVQQQIVQDLAALLEQARRQQGTGNKQPPGGGSGAAQAGAGSGNPAPGPARDSTSRLERGSKEQTETTDVKDLFRRIWGNLPDKLREEMQASLSEQFLPKYERLIEEYYKRLAEEQPGGP